METNFSKRRFLGAIAGAGIAVGMPQVVRAEAATYPTRPVTLLVPFSAGGANDLSMRITADFFQKATGQPLVIENRPGGGTLVAMRQLKAARPDGYTLGNVSRSLHVAHWMNQKASPVHPLNDVTYISALYGSIFGILAPAGSPYKTLKDVVAAAKASPGKLSIGSLNPGGAHHLIALQFANAAGIEVVHVPFKGESESNTAALGGHVDLCISSGSFIPHVKADKLRLLALASRKRLREYPEWRTAAEQGYDFAAEVVIGVGGPPNVAPDLTRRIDAIFKEITANPAYQEALMKLHQPVSYMNHAEFRTFQEEQFQKEYDVLKRLNLLPES